MMAWCPHSVQPGLCDVIQDITMTRLSQILLAVLLLTSGVRPMNQDNCDTTAWDMGDEAIGVRDVSGSCAEGHIDWRLPYGAIRISLQPKSPHEHGKFEACFISSVHHTTVKFFLDDAKTGLKPLTVLSGSSPRMLKELCFVSESDPVVLYVESDLDGESAAQGLVKIDYDIKKVPGPGQRQHDECRPCTSDEILEAVCTSDLVFHGSMDLVSHNADMTETSLHLKVNKMYRQRSDIFKDPNGVKNNPVRKYPRLKFHTEHGVREWPVTQALASRPVKHSSQSDGVIIAPHKCGVTHGDGDFLFIGRIRFQKAYLHCAPRLDDFIDMWNRAKQSGHAQCSLD